MGEMLYVKKWGVYQKIHRLKKQGEQITKISLQLAIDRHTVYKYLSMNEEEFYKFLKNSRCKNSKSKRCEELVRKVYELNKHLCKREIYLILEKDYDVDISYRTLCRIIDKIK